MYLATFLLKERHKLDAGTGDWGQQEIQDRHRVILEDGPFEAIHGLEDVRVEAVPKIRFTAEEPEMATDEVHIFFPAMDGKRRTRWLRNLATEITTPELGPGARPTLQISI